MQWIVECTIAELQRLMTTGERNGVQIVEAYLDRIRAIDTSLCSVVEVNPDALEIAEALDRERESGSIRGPLHGIPILLKENIDTADKMLTTAGSLALMDSMPLRDSVTASILRDAGAVILGKTAMSEWAFFRSTSGTSGWSARNGQVHNPHVLDRTPGGSSSGSGVAAAASLAAATIGTETDGSIMSPASASGVVGIKPTVGLTSRDGVIPISHSQDSVGPIARTVADAAAVLGGLTGTDYLASIDPEGLEGARIGVARGLFGHSRVTNEVIDRALERLSSGGAMLFDVDLSRDEEMLEAERLVLHYEFKADIKSYLATRSAGSPRSLVELIDFNVSHANEELAYFGQESFELAQSKGPLTDVAYLDALATGHRLSRDNGLDRVLDAQNLNALVAPTAAPAPPIDLVNGERFLVGSAAYAAVAGYPLITVPAGDVFGLPVGMTFMGRARSEMTLIRLASGFEAVSGPRLVPALIRSIPDLAPGAVHHRRSGPEA